MLACEAAVSCPLVSEESTLKEVLLDQSAVGVVRMALARPSIPLTTLAFTILNPLDSQRNLLTSKMHS